MSYNAKETSRLEEVGAERIPQNVEVFAGVPRMLAPVLTQEVLKAPQDRSVGREPSRTSSAETPSHINRPIAGTISTFLGTLSLAFGAEALFFGIPAFLNSPAFAALAVGKTAESVMAALAGVSLGFGALPILAGLGLLALGGFWLMSKRSRK